MANIGFFLRRIRMSLRRFCPPMITASLLFWGSLTAVTFAQSVCLPAPRLLTTMPMGGKVGTQFDIIITGDHLDDADELRFSDPHITAARKLTATGEPVPNQYVVTIAEDCPVGAHEARLMTRLGISSSRVFSVGKLDEVRQEGANTSLSTAMKLNVNSICNAAMSVKAVDHYTFDARKGQRVIVDCAAKGIDSKLNLVLIVADAAGRDLIVERQSGALDFTAPADGKYVIKVHDLTFKGGPAYFYRLGVWELPAGEEIVRLPSTQTVNSVSWPPQGLPAKAAMAEIEPNNHGHAQKITLPCDIAGSFFPAADIDVFEFEAKKGDVWWVEVGSERFDLPTDPTILVQHVTGSGADEKLTDVAELTDLPSPVKVSSFGYAYDGPPYNVGSSDILAKLEIKEDGLHRLQLSDLFGGTRSDPRNIYRLVIRKAAPDFAVVAWALHMELRNGDRNALSKPLALRGGATMALEVVAIRRDGFDGDIDLVMEGLPEGVTAQGLKIPAGKSRGMMLVTAAADAPRGLTSAQFYGQAEIDGQVVTHPCRLASMAWPIPDAWQEIPSPRLLADVPVSVSGIDFAPISVAPAAGQVLEATVGEKLSIPLLETRRSEFSGASMKLRAMGAGFEGNPVFDLPLTTDRVQAELDLAKLKTPPGTYVVAFYGSAVAKYRHQPEAIGRAEQAKLKAEQDLAALEAELKQLTEQAQATPEDGKQDAEKAIVALTERKKTALDAVTAAENQLKAATQAAQPRDIVDIVVTEPITIHVQPAGTK